MDRKRNISYMRNAPWRVKYNIKVFFFQYYHDLSSQKKRKRLKYRTVYIFTIRFLFNFVAKIVYIFLIPLLHFQELNKQYQLANFE